MGVNPSDNVAIFPIAKISPSIGKHSDIVVVQLEKDDRLPQGTTVPFYRLQKRHLSLEKGSFLNIYV